MSEFHDDSPILSPEDDLLGHNALAKSIAKCILSIPSPNGDVIAVHGPWGSGKSSTINLVLHDLKRNEDKKTSLAIIPFNSWCYRSEDGIVAGFFQEFYSGLSSTESKVRVNAEVLLKLGARLIGPAKLLELGLELAGMPGASGLIQSSSEAVSELMSEDSDTETLQRKVEKEIEKTKKRFLIVIDDIDRLSSEEAIAIFRVIKSVGRLKNVTYLLSYDRIITEKTIAGRYPSEGSHYLEKMVQANFDLPKPDKIKIINVLNSRFEKIFSNNESHNYRRIYDIVYKFVIPEIRTIRQVHRFANTLSITYPSVKNDVDAADFIALEAFRQFWPNVYNCIRSNKSILTRSMEDKLTFVPSPYNVKNVFLKCESEAMQSTLRDSLILIFPQLDPNPIISATFNEYVWHQEKRACSTFHFDTYFSFAASSGDITEWELKVFCQYASNRKFVNQKMLEYTAMITPTGRSKASIFLDMIYQNGHMIDAADAIPLLASIYCSSIDFDAESDIVYEFGCRVSNRERVKRLGRAILLDRSEGSSISDASFRELRKAPLDLLVNFCCLLHENATYKNENGNKHSRARVIIDEDEVKNLKEITLKRLDDSFDDKSIFECRNVSNILSGWAKISGSNNNTVKVLKYMISKPNNKIMKSAQDFLNVFPGHENCNGIGLAISRWLNNQDDYIMLVFRLSEMLVDMREDDRKSVIRFIEIIDAKVPEW